MSLLATVLLLSGFASGSVFIVALLLKFFYFAARRRKGAFTVAFFHPYCNDGGGGERVLWSAVKAVQERKPEAVIYIYTGDVGATPSSILSKVNSYFSIQLPDPEAIQFVFLYKRRWIEAKSYPYFTMLGQSLGSILLGWEALSAVNPHLFIDSMGYAFTYPLFSILGGCRIATYTHYPTISMDMLSRVMDRTAAHNNADDVASSWLKSQLKLAYYRVFSCMYGFVGSFAEVIFVNSTWTEHHIRSIWKKDKEDEVHVLYPPCNTEELQCFPLKASRHATGRPPIVISIAQYRPEKDHELQIRAFAALIPRLKRIPKGLQLVLIGSCRNEDDNKRVQHLRDLVVELQLSEYVSILVNISYQERNNWLATASAGIHTMWCEHFGIGVVEFMAAGAIAIAHASGGPKLDIVVPFEGQPTGFLASTVEEYATALKEVIEPEDASSIYQMRGRARRLVQSRFADEQFSSKFKQQLLSF